MHPNTFDHSMNHFIVHVLSSTKELWLAAHNMYFKIQSLMDSAHIISADVRVDGVIRGTGTLRVAGTIEGAIELEGDVVLDASAHTEGSIKGRNVDIQGHVAGDVDAERSLVIGKDAVVRGDIQATNLSIHPNASLKGRISMRLDLPSGLKERGTRRSRR